MGRTALPGGTRVSAGIIQTQARRRADKKPHRYTERAPLMGNIAASGTGGIGYATLLSRAIRLMGTEELTRLACPTRRVA